MINADAGPNIRAQHFNLQTSVRAATVLLVSGIALAGCGASKHASRAGTEQILDQPSPTDVLSGVAARVGVLDETMRKEYGEFDIKAAHKIIVTLPAGKLRVTEEKAADACAAEDALQAIGQSSSGYGDKEDRKRLDTDLAAIASPKIRTQISSELAKTKVQDEFQTAQGSYDDAEKAKATKTLSNLPDSPQKRAAQQLLQIDKIKALTDRLPDGVDAYDEHELSADQIRAELAKIDDPKLEKAANILLDEKISIDILTKVADRSLSAPAARVDIRKGVQNSTIKKHAVNNVKYAQQDYYYEEDPEELDYLIYRAHGEPLSALEDRSQAVIDDIDSDRYDLQNEFDYRAGGALYDAKLELTKMIKQHNAVATDQDSVQLSPLEQPERAIDLRKVKGTKFIPNLFKKYFKDEAEGEPKNFKQFAEVYAEGGEVVTHFEKQNGISSTAVGRIKEAIKRATPVWRAAFASGDLLTVRFIKDGDFDPLYDPGTHEIMMTVPNDASTSIDQLSAAGIHEGAHALTRDIDSIGANISEKQTVALNKACTNLRTSVYRTLEADLSLTPSIIQQARQHAKPKDRKIFDALEAKAKNGTLAKYAAGQFEGYSDSTYLNNCSDITLGDILASIGDDLDKDHEYDLKLDYLTDKHHLKKLSEAWDLANDYGNLFKKLNESQFVKTEYAEKDLLGHSQENTDEMIATVTDIAISYPDQLKRVLGGMSHVDRTAIVSALDASFDLISTRHPSIKDSLHHLRARIVNR